ncbi:protein kinase superfamily protein isoform X1 [Tasmannia lanceolata]|uniref:protein kinase superfamily protein isoform X1 n=1 Tax=Tasmannia lanceolata TaxID=3420 RepID=UPI004062950D
MLLHLPPNSPLLPSNFKSNSPRFPPRRNNPPPFRFRSSKNSPEFSESRDVDTFTKYSGYLFEGGTPEADSLTTYDPSKIASIYRRKPIILIRRLFQIGTTLGRWFGLRYLDSVMERSSQMFKIRAAELRGILVELGPAFVKIAQAVSSRSDVIPPAYVDELSVLQDRIAPFPTGVAFNTIEQELGSPIDMLFSEISPEPIAAASLGQVYQAKLRPGGEIVAVKVQRPGVQAAISLDIFILRFLAGLIRRAAKFNTDLQAVVDEWAASLFREMDYRAEARNGQKFRMLYGGLEDVFVPEMYLERSSRKVLIMEWVEGQKLSEVKDLYLVEVGVYCSLSQLLEYGFYHADPHPGNLLRTNEGKLAYLDFGMMGEFRQELRYGFVEACLHLVNRDFEALANDFVTLGLLPPTVQKGEVTKALTDVFQSAVNKGVRNISFGDLSGNLGRTMYKFKFQIPSYFSLVIRSLAVLEGIAITFNPDYKVLSSSYPWIARKVLTDSSPQLRLTLQALLYKEGVFRIDRLESLLREGAFVREILLQEFVKGIDALGVVTFDSVTSMFPFAALFSPSLMVDEDVNNLRTFRRLMLLLSRIQNNETISMGVRDVNTSENSRTYTEEASLVLYQLASVQEILPILSIIPELPTESQQQLTRLPADFAGRLVSRIVARTLRRVLI